MRKAGGGLNMLIMNMTGPRNLRIQLKEKQLLFLNLRSYMRT